MPLNLVVFDKIFERLIISQFSQQGFSVGWFGYLFDNPFSKFLQFGEELTVGIVADAMSLQRSLRPLLDKESKLPADRFDPKSVYKMITAYLSYCLHY